MGFPWLKLRNLWLKLRTVSFPMGFQLQHFFEVNSGAELDQQNEPNGGAIVVKRIGIKNQPVSPVES